MAEKLDKNLYKGKRDLLEAWNRVMKGSVSAQKYYFSVDKEKREKRHKQRGIPRTSASESVKSSLALSKTIAKEMKRRLDPEHYRYIMYQTRKNVDKWETEARKDIKDKSVQKYYDKQKKRREIADRKYKARVAKRNPPPTAPAPKKPPPVTKVEEKPKKPMPKPQPKPTPVKPPPKKGKEKMPKPKFNFKEDMDKLDKIKKPKVKVQKPSKKKETTLDTVKGKAKKAPMDGPKGKGKLETGTKGLISKKDKKKVYVAADPKRRKLTKAYYDSLLSNIVHDSSRDWDRKENDRSYDKGEHARSLRYSRTLAKFIRKRYGEKYYQKVQAGARNYVKDHEGDARENSPTSAHKKYLDRQRKLRNKARSNVKKKKVEGQKKKVKGQKKKMESQKKKMESQKKKMENRYRKRRVGPRPKYKYLKVR